MVKIQMQCHWVAKPYHRLRYSVRIYKKCCVNHHHHHNQSSSRTGVDIWDASCLLVKRQNEVRNPSTSRWRLTNAEKEEKQFPMKRFERDNMAKSTRGRLCGRRAMCTASLRRKNSSSGSRWSWSEATNTHEADTSRTARFTYDSWRTKRLWLIEWGLPSIHHNDPGCLF